MFSGGFTKEGTELKLEPHMGWRGEGERGVPGTIPQVLPRLSPLSLGLLEAGTVSGSSVSVEHRRMPEREELRESHGMNEQ